MAEDEVAHLLPNGTKGGRLSPLHAKESPPPNKFLPMSSAPTCQSPTTRLGDYWVQSRGPLASLVFVLPLLAVYEVGVLSLGPRAIRNGADDWLRQLLDLIGFGQYFLLPVLTICLLLAWQHTTRQPWRFNTSVLWGMAVESIVLAVMLRIILQLQNSLLHTLAEPTGEGSPPVGVLMSVAGSWRELVGFLGAGVYEELLFRLILLSLLVWTARRLGAAPRPATVAAVLITSLIFAAAHYVGPYGEPVKWLDHEFWHSLLFRFLAGIFFGVLFVYRGFGITAGAHAGYDILVGIV